MNQIVEKLTQKPPTAKLRDDNAIFERMLQKQSEASKAEEPVSQRREIIFVIRGIPEHYCLIDQYPLILGRNDYYVREPIDVDFTPYGGLERGVSRSHAQIQVMKDGNVYITDLGSTNGTHIAGRRLIPHKAYLLTNYNHLMLGCLPLLIRFDQD